MIQDFISCLHRDNFRPGNEPLIIFDVGSRDCVQSVEFANAFPNSRIFAFECNPNTLGLCKTNIVNYPNITLIDKAVHTYDGECTFYPIDQQKTITTWQDGNPGASSIFKSNGTYAYETYVQTETTVPCTRIDTVMEQHGIPHVDLMWMDLQGAELIAFESMGKYADAVSYIHTEVSYKPIYTDQVMFDELHTYLTGKGYTNLNNPSYIGWQQDIIYKNTRKVTPRLPV